MAGRVYRTRTIKRIRRSKAEMHQLNDHCWGYWTVITRKRSGVRSTGRPCMVGGQARQATGRYSGPSYSFASVEIFLSLTSPTAPRWMRKPTPMTMLTRS